MSLLALAVVVTVFLSWSDVTNAIQQHRPTKPHPSLYTSLEGYKALNEKTEGHSERRRLSSRRNVLCSIASGVTIAIPSVVGPPTHLANAATSTATSKPFRSYEVQPDASEKLNPTLKTLTVNFLTPYVHAKNTLYSRYYSLVSYRNVI
jgi:hypothetical protein